MDTKDKAAEALRLAEYMRGMVQTYPQMSEDEPGGYCTEVDQCMDQAIALLREYAALLQAQQPVACMVETESAIMTWPITSLDEARTYCDEGEEPVLLYTRPQPVGASCMVERGETVDLTLIADPVRRAAFEAYHNTHSGHYDRLCAAIEAAAKAQPVEAQRVYLVPTGVVHEGQETYTRHDEPVPLADQEVLYTRPQPAEAGRVNAPESKSQMKRLAVQRGPSTKDFQLLTDDAIHEEFHRRMSADAEDMAMDSTDFRLGARFAERHHGILPKEQEVLVMTPKLLRQAVGEFERYASRFCENCPTEDACQLRGSCAHHLPKEQPAKSRNCPDCRGSDSWGHPAKAHCSMCEPTENGNGSLFECLNDTKEQS
jgi:hypothetical protein